MASPMIVFLVVGLLVSLRLLKSDKNMNHLESVNSNIHAVTLETVFNASENSKTSINNGKYQNYVQYIILFRLNSM